MFLTLSQASSSFSQNRFFQFAAAMFCRHIVRERDQVPFRSIEKISPEKKNEYPFPPVSSSGNNQP